MHCTLTLSPTPMLPSECYQHLYYYNANFLLQSSNKLSLFKEFLSVPEFYSKP